MDHSLLLFLVRFISDILGHCGEIIRPYLDFCCRDVNPGLSNVKISFHSLLISIAELDRALLLCFRIIISILFFHIIVRWFGFFEKSVEEIKPQQNHTK